MGNTRAMQWKASSEEYDAKMADIKRLNRWLEEEIEKIVRRGPIKQYTWKKRIEDLEIHLKVDRLALKNLVEFYMVGFSHDDRASIDALRTIHRNLDDIIELAEEVCCDLGADRQFTESKRRFGFQ